MGHPALSMNNSEYALLFLEEMTEMIEGMETNCLKSIPADKTEDERTWTAVGVVAAFSAMKQAFKCVQTIVAKNMEDRYEAN